LAHVQLHVHAGAPCEQMRVSLFVCARISMRV
jgi:hypothetical protein